eukprot:COSAG02_NODE_19890_length_860_cov_0.536137_1_plen_135_part_01
MEHSLDHFEEVGQTTGAAATALCCVVFGRDETGSELTFTEQHIETLLSKWSQIVQPTGPWKGTKPSADNIFALDLCISDENKPRLLANSRFLPYLVDALLLDPDHIRAGMKDEQKSWCQTHHAACFAQLAMFEPA